MSLKSYRSFTCWLAITVTVNLAPVICGAQTTISRAQGVSREFKKSHQENEARIQAIIAAQMDALVQAGVVASIDEVYSVSDKSKKRFSKGRLSADDLFQSSYRLKSGAKAYGLVEPVADIRFTKEQSRKGYYIKAVGSFRVQRIQGKEKLQNIEKNRLDRWVAYSSVNKENSKLVHEYKGHASAALREFVRAPRNSYKTIREFGLLNNYQVDFYLDTNSDKQHFNFRFKINFEEVSVVVDERQTKLSVKHYKDQKTTGDFFLGRKLKFSVRVINHLHYLYVNEKFVGSFDNLADADSELIGFQFWRVVEKFTFEGFEMRKISPYH